MGPGREEMDNVKCGNGSREQGNGYAVNDHFKSSRINNFQQIYNDFMSAEQKKDQEMHTVVTGNLTGMALKKFEELWVKKIGGEGVDQI